MTWRLQRFRGSFLSAAPGERPAKKPCVDNTVQLVARVFFTDIGPRDQSDLQRVGRRVNQFKAVSLLSERGPSAEASGVKHRYRWCVRFFPVTQSQSGPHSLCDT